MLKRIDLGGERAAWIREETTIGEYEQIQYLEKYWVEPAAEHVQDMRRASLQALVCVRRWENMDGLSWPDLEDELEHTSKALETRYNALKRCVGVKTLKTINDTVTAAMLPSEQLEGN